MAKKLTPNQEIFVNEYLIDRNGTRAYLKAYPNVKNENVAAVNANRLLRNAKVMAAIDEALEKQKKRTEITSDQVLGNIKRLGEKAEGADKYSDALKAQELLGKHFKLFVDRKEISGDLIIESMIPEPEGNNDASD